MQIDDRTLMTVTIRIRKCWFSVAPVLWNFSLRMKFCLFWLIFIMSKSLVFYLSFLLLLKMDSDTVRRNVIVISNTLSKAYAVYMFGVFGWRQFVNYFFYLSLLLLDFGSYLCFALLPDVLIVSLLLRRLFSLWFYSALILWDFDYLLRFDTNGRI